jgi:hypothetical protein
MQETKTAFNRLGRAGAFAAMMLLGLLLAGCDKCGNWFSAAACHEGGPKPQSFTGGTAR